MNFETIMVAVGWGVISGYLLLRALHSLLAIAICLHGMLPGRWERLAMKATPRQVRYGLIFGLLMRFVIYAVLCAYLLNFGDNFVQEKFQFDYWGTSGLIWAALAGVTAAFFFSTSWRRLVVTWKMTHEFGYAERRQKDLSVAKVQGKKPQRRSKRR